MRFSMLRYATVLLLAGCSGGGGGGASVPVCPGFGNAQTSSSFQLVWPTDGATVSPAIGSVYFDFGTSLQGTTESFSVVLRPTSGPSITAGPASVTTSLPPGANPGSEFNPCPVESTSCTTPTITDYVAPISALAASTTYSVFLTATVRAPGCQTQIVANSSFTTD